MLKVVGCLPDMVEVKMTDCRNLIEGKSTEFAVFCFMFYRQTNSIEVLLLMRIMIINFNNIPAIRVYIFATVMLSCRREVDI